MELKLNEMIGPGPGPGAYSCSCPTREAPSNLFVVILIGMGIDSIAIDILLRLLVKLFLPMGGEALVDDDGCMM